MTHRILLADDDEAFTALLSMTLTAEGYEVTSVRDGEDVFGELEREAYDLLVCDVNMERVDGFTVCRDLRERGESIPIVLLTSRDSDIDEALGLDLGADDYVSKPFKRRVLLARVRALLRRAQAREAQPVEDDEVIERGALRVDVARMEVVYAGEKITMTVTELRLLVGMMRQPGVVLGRASLLRMMRDDGDSFVHERMVDAYINRLRRKLEAAHQGFAALETVIGAGYRWRDDGV